MKYHLRFGYHQQPSTPLCCHKLKPCFPCALSFGPHHLASLKWHQLLLPTHQLTDQLSLILRSRLSQLTNPHAHPASQLHSQTPFPFSFSAFLPFCNLCHFLSPLVFVYTYWGHACRRVYGPRQGWRWAEDASCLIARNELVTEWGDWKTVTEEKTASLGNGKCNQRTITIMQAYRYLLSLSYRNGIRNAIFKGNSYAQSDPIQLLFIFLNKELQIIVPYIEIIITIMHTYRYLLALTYRNGIAIKGNCKCDF